MSSRTIQLFLIPLVSASFALSAAAQSQAPGQSQRSGQSQARPASPSKSGSSQTNGQQAGASVSASNSTSATASAGPDSLGIASGTAINAQLITPVDARKVHTGEEIAAKTTQNVKENGRVVLRKGTHLIGHIAEAQERTKANAESSVRIVFDEAVTKDGEHFPFHASIEAIAEAQSAAAAGLDDAGMMDGMSGMAGGSAHTGGLLGGGGAAVSGVASNSGAIADGLNRTAGDTLGAASSATGSAAGNIGGLNAAGELTSRSRGVFGMQGLNLESSSSSAAGSLITARNSNVHLSSGTQMVLSVISH